MDFNEREATFTKNCDGVGDSLHRYGCALIKGLLEPAALAGFDKRIAHHLEGAAQALASVGAPKGFNVGYPLYFASAEPRVKVHSVLAASYPQIFDPSKMHGLDCLSLPRYIFGQLEKAKLVGQLERYLQVGRLYTSPAICHIRSFAPVDRADMEEAKRGLALHQDNKAYRISDRMLTLWFPFRYEHGKMASLEILPTPSNAFLPTEGEGIAISPEHFPASEYWRPEYELGDALLISGFLPHRTYYPEGTERERTSCDFRFFSSKVPAPIYARPWFRF